MEISLEMKSIIMILFPIFLTLQDLNINILETKAGFKGINGRMFNSIYKQDESQLDSIISILNLDVLEYYKLKLYKVIRFLRKYSHFADLIVETLPFELNLLKRFIKFLKSV